MTKNNHGVIDVNIFWKLTFILVMATVAIAPYFRGLFFASEQMVALMVLSVAFFVTCLWKVSQREYSVLPTSMSYFALLFLLSYLVPFLLGAADRELAFIEFLKTFMFIAVFWSVTNLTFNKKKVNLVIRSLYVSGALVGIIAIAGAMGFFQIKDGFSNFRLFTSLQYPNTAAALLLSIFVLGIYLLEKDRLPYLYMPVQTITMLAFFSTLSRGAFLVWLVVIALFYVFVPGSKRMSFLTTMLISSVPAYLIHEKFLLACADGNTETAFFMVLIAIFLTMGLTWCRNKIIETDWFQKRNQKAIIAIETVLVVIFMIQAVFGFSFMSKPSENNDVIASDTTTETMAPTEETDSATIDREISLETYSAWSRLFWMREAVEEIFMEHPIFGQGGGAWEASYKSFQTYNYSTTQVHSSWVQILVETGLVGFLSFLGIWLMLIFYGFRIWHKGNDEQKLLQASIVVSALTLGGHALIDFDFSLSCTMLFLFALFGVSNSLHQIEKKEMGHVLPLKQANKWKIPVIALALVISLGSGYFGLAYKLSRNEEVAAVQAIQEGKYDEGIGHFLSSVKYWPLNKDALMDIATYYIQNKDYDLALGYLEKAQKISPYDSSVYLEQLKISWQREDYADAIEKASKAVELAPWNNKYRTVQSDLYLMTSLRLIQESGETDEDNSENTKEYLEMALEYPKHYEEMRSIRRNLMESTVLKIDPIAESPSIRSNAGAAAYILGNFDQSIQILKGAIDQDLTTMSTYFWLILDYDKLGNNEEVQKYLELMEKEEWDNNFNTDTLSQFRKLPELWEAVQIK